MSEQSTAVVAPAGTGQAVVHELQFRAGTRKEALRRHDVLFGFVALVAVAALGLAATGRLRSAFGTYAVTTHGSIVPLGSFELAFRHLAVLSLGFGIVPLILGFGWALASLWRLTTRACGVSCANWFRVWSSHRKSGKRCSICFQVTLWD